MGAGTVELRRILCWGHKLFPRPFLPSPGHFLISFESPTVVLRKFAFGELSFQVLPAIADPHLVPSPGQGAGAAGQGGDWQQLLTVKWNFSLERRFEVALLPHTQVTSGCQGSCAEET